MQEQLNSHNMEEIHLFPIHTKLVENTDSQSSSLCNSRVEYFQFPPCNLQGHQDKQDNPAEPTPSHLWFHSELGHAPCINSFAQFAT